MKKLIIGIIFLLFVFTAHAKIDYVSAKYCEFTLFGDIKNENNIKNINEIIQKKLINNGAKSISNINYILGQENENTCIYAIAWYTTF